MKTRIMLFLTLLLSVLGASAQNTITIGNVEMEYLSLGQSVSVPVTMDNIDDIVAVELIVKVAPGGSINADGCQLSPNRANGHQVSAACIDGENNLWKVTVFSALNKSFMDNSGQLLTLDVVTGGNWLDGHTYALTATKALLCKSNGDNVCTAYESGSIYVPNTPHADIALDVTGIVTTVKKDSLNNYILGITNNGTATTGAITMQLPDWMSLQGALMPINPGETANAVIAMAPTGEANTRFDGYIGINIANGNSQILPYNVTIVSDAKGTIVFSVCDEYTYYDAAAPKVQNATIEVRNSSTGEVVETLTTGTDGTATMTQPEGYYEYTVTAESHETYTNNILIYPGQTIERTVNLSLGDGINIEYQVVETEEGDGYVIVTEATLEVAVPAPQVTISAPGRVKMSDVAVGEYVDVQVTLTNRGLIKARDVTLVVPEIEGFSWQALTPIVFDLRPQETSFITIRYTREEESEGCSIMWLATYTWKCGDEPKWRECKAFTTIGNNCKPCLPCNCTVATVMEDEDVIVTVKMQFNQLLTLTRQGFEGTLTIQNGSDKAMDDIVLNLTETMPNGTLATDREFDISYTEFTGFSGNIDGPWTLDAGKTGVLKVKFIPTKYAAPIAATDYVFGGSLTFSVDGKERHADLAEQLMTVKPTPELNLDYFMQRDVIGDDAITKDVVELSEEAEFAVLISNVGYGDAENLRMVTAQPEMVDNEESLFLQYSITSSQLNGQEKTLAFGKSVTTDFGTIPAHGHAYAQWWMTSSLLGHFIDYDVSYTQLTMSQNPNLSLLGEVKIHELIRSIVVEGNANADYAWAVNEEEDAANLPDKLYLVDGTTQPIATGTATMLDGSDLEYTLTLEAGTDGWTYAKVADPTGGSATITEVTRADGTVLSLRNIWQTWATLPDKKRATHEDLIHIIDNVQSGTTTYTVRFTPKPAATLNIISVKLNGVSTTDDISVSNAEVQSVEMNFTADIREVKPKALSLVNQAEAGDMANDYYSINGSKLNVDLSNIPHNDGFFCLTVNTALITDVDGHVGLTATPVSWIEQTDKPVDLNLAYNFANAATVMVLAEEYHGEKTTYDTPQVPADKYKYGTTLTLQVTPAYGYIFSRWSIDGNIVSTEKTYDYYLSAAKELKLFFDRESFNLSVTNIVDDDADATGTGGGTVKGGGSGLYEYGEEVTLTAEPERCHSFVGWYTTDVAPSAAKGHRHAPSIDGYLLLTTEPTYTYTVGGEMTLYPVFHRLGDVNGDGKFTTADALLEASYLLNGTAEDFVATEGDANSDGTITLADAVEIANSLSRTTSTQGEGTVTLTVPDVTVVQGDTANVVVNFDFGSTAFTAWQFDIAYPEGIRPLTTDDGIPAYLQSDVYGDEHSISSTRTASGLNRFQCFSVSSAPLNAQSGTLLSLPIKANRWMEEGTYQVTLSPVEFVQTDAVQVKPASTTFNIVVTKRVKPDVITYNMTKGWNWVSSPLGDALQRDSHEFVSLAGDQATRLVGITSELVNDPEYGWVGNLSEMSITEGYKLLVTDDVVFTSEGMALNPALNPVQLSKGWNWMGYTPVYGQTLTDALSALEAQEGDQIREMDNFSVFDENGAWIGTVQHLFPGHGYMYQAQQATTFCYAESDNIVSSEQPSVARHRQSVENCPWEYDVHSYPDQTTLVATLHVDETTVSNADGYVLGAFVDDECRGIGKPVGDSLLFVTVHGTIASHGIITFKAFNTLSGSLLLIAEQIPFDGQALGMPSSPVQLHLQNEVTALTSHTTANGNGTRYYTPAGRQISRLQQGVNIVVDTDGQVHKVLKK